MSFDRFDVGSHAAEPPRRKKFAWYWAPVFCAAWFLLFYVAAIPSYYSYPETLLVRDEHLHPDEFIGERAQIQLLGLASIGVKMTGSYANEVLALNYLLDEVAKIKADARLDLYDIDVQVQYSSGQFMLWGMATSYHNVSNIVVKIAPKGSTSQSYLLVNSHFDSECGSPAAADAGVMIVVMLETLRVISRSEQELKNPIVFLLNGAEESNLLAAHGFITQHEWAPYCKAVINLDSAGSGGREVLFQSGPDHPWLVKHYKRAAPHPYASTIAEELFQNNFIPSDSDFRIFRDYGGIPGLDMAHTLNGYVYHTKYDTFGNLERGTYQTTGDNILALARALANADELRNTTAYAEGHTVFFDYLGWFMVGYTEATGVAVNITSSVCAILVIGASVFAMTRRKAAESPKNVGVRFGTIVLVQVLTVAAAVGATLLMAIIVEALSLTQSWYSNGWLAFGLYYCPMFFVMGILPGLYIHWTRKNPMLLNDTIACFMHAHCLVLAVICITLTAMGIRSAFFVMVAVFFYAISVVLNIAADHFCKRSYYIPIHLACQLLPFWFYTYQAFSFMKVFVPMQGRDGPTSRPELMVSGFAAVMSLHFAGFIIPILHKFRKSKTTISAFGVLTLVFLIIAATPAGFPYEPDVAAQRYYALHTSRVIHGRDGQVAKNHTGFYIQPVDTRPYSLDDTTLKDANPPSWIAEECEAEVFCGLPLYNTRWMDWKNSSRWVPAGEPNLVVPTDLQLVAKRVEGSAGQYRYRYEFSLMAADHFVVYIEPLAEAEVRVVNWSFDRTPLDEAYDTPYFIYHTYSMSSDRFEFWIELESTAQPDAADLTMRLGVGAHYLYHTHLYSDEFSAFLKSFPDWTYATNWIAAFESWYF